MKRCIVSVLPDFFLDIIVKLPISFKELFERIKRKKFGGNILVEDIKIKYGGNATNFAIVLSKLGVKVNLFVVTDNFGRNLLEKWIQNLPINLYIKEGRCSKTVALEYGNVNIMLSCPGDLRYFGPEKLSEKDLEIIKKSDCLCIFNWNQNEKANELIESLFSDFNKLKYLDIGDPTVALDRLDELIEILKKGVVDVLSLNENEIRVLGKKLGIFEKNLVKLVQKVYQELNVDHIDLHTKDFAYTYPDNVLVKSFRVDEIRRITGAGDAWNAGNVFAYLQNFDPEKRLKFAHAVAALYIQEKKINLKEIEKLVFG